ncbi:MAG: hypothetical protein E7J90_08875 [Cutibacterium avidum]|nr:hypothetical protein [Cutibacterium avidum]
MVYVDTPAAARVRQIEGRYEVETLDENGEYTPEDRTYPVYQQVLARSYRLAVETHRRRRTGGLDD